MKQVLFLLLLSYSTLFAQSNQVQVVFEEFPIEGMIGVQSFSFGKQNDEVVIIGGRLDGLHQRMPGTSFDAAGHNNQLIVVNLVTKQIWKAGLENCSQAFRDQLKATNHCFYQHNDSLILVGGYGISVSADDHATFAAALSCSVSEVIAAVKSNTVNDGLFQRTEHPQLAVCGGQLNQLGDVFYLVGGHQFDGRYNPRNGPSFVQNYTNAIRRFQVKNGAIQWMPEIVDTAAFHKRDYNMVKVRNNFGKEELLALSGVFQLDEDLPNYHAVVIHEDGTYETVSTFKQFYNHYECPEVVVFDKDTKASQVFMLGGIAQYYDSLGVLVQDNDVPFTKTIARLEWDGKHMKEFLTNSKMPTYLGAGSHYIPSSNQEISIQDIGKNGLKIGYLIGGIVPEAANIFWVNEGKQSNASPTIYTVKLVRSTESDRENLLANSTMNVELLRTGKGNRYQTFFDLTEDAQVRVTYTTHAGKVIYDQQKNYEKGTRLVKKSLPKQFGWYRIKVENINTKESWEQWLWVKE